MTEPIVPPLKPIPIKDRVSVRLYFRPFPADAGMNRNII